METVCIILVLMVGCVIIGVFAEWLQAMIMPIGKTDLFDDVMGEVRRSLPLLPESITKAIDSNTPLNDVQKIVYQAHMQRLYQRTITAYVEARWPRGGTQVTDEKTEAALDARLANEMSDSRPVYKTEPDDDVLPAHGRVPGDNGPLVRTAGLRPEAADQPHQKEPREPGRDPANPGAAPGS